MPHLQERSDVGHEDHTLKRDASSILDQCRARDVEAHIELTSNSRYLACRTPAVPGQEHSEPEFVPVGGSWNAVHDHVVEASQCKPISELLQSPDRN